MTLPFVTVAIANYNSADFIEAAIASALGQAGVEVEVLVIDDASSDDSPDLVEAIAARDPRVRLDRLHRNMGPAAARNRALNLARGEWLAVLDSDDKIHPDRLARMVARGEADQADMVADDLVLFEDAKPTNLTSLLKGGRAKGPTWISVEDYLLETRLFGRSPNLGYLKPLIRVDRWRASGLRYNENLRIAEDSDLILRMLDAGFRFRLDPQPGYLYRRHPNSISHRLGSGHVQRMREAEQRFRASLSRPSSDVLRALDKHRAAIETADSFVRLLDALKARRPDKAAMILARRPQAGHLMWMPVAAKFRRMRDRLRPSPPPPDSDSVCFISRQRLAGKTNGSSTYLLSLAESLKAAGLKVHLVQPSPTVLGRWPLMKMKPDMRVFDSISIRGLGRIGDIFYSRDPGVWLEAAGIALNGVRKKLKLPSRPLPPGKHTISLPWTTQDLLYAAQKAGARADRFVLDYIFTTPVLPYLIRPQTRSALVMHDLYATRGAAFAGNTATDSISGVSAGEELSMFARAGAVVAIQQAEADYVRQHLPSQNVILAPLAADPKPAPQPGASDRVLFVGSNTPPNVMALEWFFADIWPSIKARSPEAELTVAGSVNRAFSAAPAGATFIGLAPSLEPLYAQAGVVISPLNVGSGLKIKLIEALAEGKAIVATSVTLQGVEAQAGPAVAWQDQAAGFAEAVSGLLANPEKRAELGAKALKAAHDHFSAKACYGGLIDWARQT